MTNLRIPTSQPLALTLDSSILSPSNCRSLDINGNYVKLQIWDTAGQERFRGITKSYYKGAQAVILVYDVNNPKSFEDVTSFWMKESRMNS